ADVHFLGIRSRTQLTAEGFAAAQELVAVGCFCLGTHQVDLDAGRERVRAVPEKSAAAHRGGWPKTADNAFEIRGKTLGIVGYGSIGAQLSVLAEALGMHVAFFDVGPKRPPRN